MSVVGVGPRDSTGGKVLTLKMIDPGQSGGENRKAFALHALV